MISNTTDLANCLRLYNLTIGGKISWKRVQTNYDEIVFDFERESYDLTGSRILHRIRIETKCGVPNLYFNVMVYHGDVVEKLGDYQIPNNQHIQNIYNHLVSESRKFLMEFIDSLETKCSNNQ